MTNKLPSPKTKSKQMQKGRGYGSGKGGHTIGRGMKGQKSRSGYSSPRPGFEGGQMPLSRRLPTLRGQSKKSRSRKFAQLKNQQFTLQLSEVASTVNAGDVDVDTLIEAGLINPTSKTFSIKILLDAPIDKKLNFQGIQLSASAKAAVEKAGGSVE